MKDIKVVKGVNEGDVLLCKGKICLVRGGPNVGGDNHVGFLRDEYRVSKTSRPDVRDSTSSLRASVVRDSKKRKVLEEGEVNQTEVLSSKNESKKNSSDELASEEIDELQSKMDRLEDEQFDNVVDFLKNKFKVGGKDREVELQINDFTPAQQREICNFVDSEIERAKRTGREMKKKRWTPRPEPLEAAQIERAKRLSLGIDNEEDAPHPEAAGSNEPAAQ